VIEELDGFPDGTLLLPAEVMSKHVSRLKDQQIARSRPSKAKELTRIAENKRHCNFVKSPANSFGSYRINVFQLVLHLANP
jgi:hypothetical protein